MKIKEFKTNKIKTLTFPRCNDKIILPKHIFAKVLFNNTYETVYNICKAMCKAWQKDIDVIDILKSNIRLSDAVVAGEDVILIEGTGSVIKNSREHKLLKEWLENEEYGKIN